MMNTVKINNSALRTDGFKYAHVMSGAAGFKGNEKLLSEKEQLRIATEELKKKLQQGAVRK
jgi:hypothetical protein